MAKKKKKAQYVALQISKITRTMSSATEYQFSINAPARYDKLIVQAIASIEQLEGNDRETQTEKQSLR